MVLVRETRGGWGGNWEIKSLGAGAALGWAQLLLTSQSPSPREDLGTGLVIPSDKMQIN